MKKTTKILLTVLGIIAIAFLLSPVCVELSPADIQSFSTPIWQRTDRDVWFPVFQQRGNQWYQCKTRLARVFFF